MVFFCKSSQLQCGRQVFQGHAYGVLEAFMTGLDFFGGIGFEKITDQKAVKLYKPVGCEKCRNTGFNGRTALIEILQMSDDIRNLVIQQADAHTLNQVAMEKGMQSLYEDGLRKAMAGVTSLEEVLRVTQY